MRIVRTAVIAAAILLLTSCNAYRRLGYLKDMAPGISYSMPMGPDPKITKGDRLNINVTCSTPELAAPFNVFNGVYMPAESTDGIATSGVRVSEDNASSNGLDGFSVDQSGEIIYPVLGRVPVAGMTLTELKDYIEGELKSRKLIKDPIVTTSFCNFNVILLGEGGKGVYSIPEGRINLFELLARSHDLTDDAVRNEIWVIRTSEGKRQLYTVNLQTKDCFFSPGFYLQQNDMVYVKPKALKRDSAINNRWQAITSITSILGALVNVIFWTSMTSTR